MKMHNFYAGPAVLPQETIDGTIEALREFAGTGMSLAEISHRIKEFESIMAEAQSLFKEILSIPEGYQVLFLGGGASLQFCMVPFNLMRKKAAYLNTGTWASKALKEAKLFGDVVEIRFDPEGKDFATLPADYEIPADADYFHITTNNTIYGTEIRYDMDSPVPLVADMSSDIFSRPVDVSKYALIYGGAQKNLAPAGVTFVIVREDVLGKVTHKIPSMLDYRTHIKEGSMFNTPPVIPIYAAVLTLRWIKANGGVAEMERRNIEKAAILYDEIERNSLFFTPVNKDDRSIMNVYFNVKPEHEALYGDFLKFATAQGMIGLKGHRSVGGYRASLYNALAKESVEELVRVMRDDEKAKLG